MEPSSTSPTSTFSYSAGERIAGKYVLEALIGEGGMGAVWSATNTLLDAPVAIKLIRGDQNRESLSQRLLQEARAAARLGHPAIVRVFDIGETDRGDPFIVMELLSGRSLAELLLDEGRLAPIRSVQILLPIADALTVAHSKGIVHRDIKPENVFLVMDDEQVQPKLVDFGIAKLEQRKEPSVLTQMGTVLGSPDYMSPEQARGRDDVDYRTDVWSFSVMLYEAVTGSRPFDGANYNALLRSIVEDEPLGMRTLLAGDEGLEAIVKTGMMKDPSQRWRSMGELGKALAMWLREQGVHEDACGVSLDAKWLRRGASDPARLTPRATLTSVPDSWEPFTGVQTKRPSGGSATLPANTPLPEPSAEQAPWSTRRRLGLAAGVVVAMVALTVLAFAWTRTPAGDAASRPETRAEPNPEPAREEPLPKNPAVVVTALPTPTAPPTPELSESAAKIPTPAPAREPRAPLRRRVPPPAASEKAEKKAPVKEPGLDLLSPY